MSNSTVSISLSLSVSLLLHYVFLPKYQLNAFSPNKKKKKQARALPVCFSLACFLPFYQREIGRQTSTRTLKLRFLRNRPSFLPCGSWGWQVEGVFGIQMKTENFITKLFMNIQWCKSKFPYLTFTRKIKQHALS